MAEGDRGRWKITGPGRRRGGIPIPTTITCAPCLWRSARRGPTTRKLHDSWDYGSLYMGAYQFG
jgi:hypothetical protein